MSQTRRHSQRNRILLIITFTVLTVLLGIQVLATPASAQATNEEPTEHYTRENRVYVRSATATTPGIAWNETVDLNATQTQLGKLDTDRSYTYLIATWYVHFRPGALSGAVYEADFEIENTTIQSGCDFPRTSFASGTDQWIATKTQTCRIDGPLLAGNKEIALNITQSQNIAYASASIQIINVEHQDVENMQIDLNTSALLDLVWLLWAAYAVLVYKITNRPVQVVTGLFGYTALFLPLAGLQWTILFAAQSALIIMILIDALTTD